MATVRSTIRQTWPLPNGGVLVVLIDTPEPLRPHEHGFLVPLMQAAEDVVEVLTPAPEEA